MIGHPSPTDPDDWTAALLYRAAYGLARSIIEAGRHSLGYGRFAGREGAERLGEAVVGELRRMGGWIEGDQGAKDVVARAVEDAIEGRRPGW